MDTDEAGRLINRLRRVEGQSRGLQRMIEEGRSCEEIFTQLAATKAALDRVGVLLISLKMRECLAKRPATPSPPRRPSKRPSRPFSSTRAASSRPLPVVTEKLDPVAQRRVS